MIRVAVADGHALIRSGLRAILENEEDMTVVGEATDGQQAVELAVSNRPDVILMDLEMPGLDGIEATLRIARDKGLAGVRVLILTAFESEDQVFKALRGGASGFLLKDSEPAEVVGAVRALASGHAQLSPRITRRLIEELGARPAWRPSTASKLEELTVREREVMALVAQGLTNREIAQRLVVSPATAKTHVSRTMLKLDARDRARLVVLAYQSGLVAPGGAAGELAADTIAGRPAVAG